VPARCPARRQLPRRHALARGHTKRGVYQEVLAPERLVFTYAWEDADGQPGPATRVTVTFEPCGGRTLLTLHQTGFDSIAARDSHRTGWTSCFERFAEFTATLPGSVLLERPSQ
jgi:uncharacterized protein YndB with AHSA1/START domain